MRGARGPIGRALSPRPAGVLELGSPALGVRGHGVGDWGAVPLGRERRRERARRGNLSLGSGAAPRIPRIPARPGFSRHVVALCAALTVKLRGDEHSPASERVRTSQGAPDLPTPGAQIEVALLRNKEKYCWSNDTLICKDRQEGCSGPAGISIGRLSISGT